MRIAFDAFSLDDGPSGAKTRLRVLAPELARRGHDVVVWKRPIWRDDDGAAWGGVERVNVADAPADFRARVLRGAAVHAKLLRARTVDVVVAETWPMPQVPRLIAVVHDLRRLHGPAWERAVFARVARAGLARAACVHVVSNSVRTELAASGLAGATPVAVVPNAAVAPALAAPDRAGLPSSFVVVVGHPDERKDLGLVDGAAARLAGEAVVIRVGRGGGGARSGMRFMDLGPVDDAFRDRLYRAASAVLAPSRLEGFGLSPLEALAQGAWTAASDIPAHREVLGEAADYFQPGDAAAAAEAARRAVRAGPAAREERRALGRRRAAEWTPARAGDAFEASLSAVASR